MPRSPHLIATNGMRSISSDPGRPSDNNCIPDPPCCSESP